MQNTCCTEALGSMGVIWSKRLCVMKLREERRPAISKFRRVVSVKIGIENSKTSNVATDFKSLGSEEVRADERKGFGLVLLSTQLCHAFLCFHTCICIAL